MKTNSRETVIEWLTANGWHPGYSCFWSAEATGDHVYISVEPSVNLWIAVNVNREIAWSLDTTWAAPADLIIAIIERALADVPKSELATA